MLKIKHSEYLENINKYSYDIRNNYNWNDMRLKNIMSLLLYGEDKKAEKEFNLLPRFNQLILIARYGTPKFVEWI